MIAAARTSLVFGGWLVVVAVPAGCSKPAAPPEVVKAFSPSSDKPITVTGVSQEEGGWRLDAAAAGGVPLFEVPGETCDQCRLVYRAKIKTTDLASPAYLEMWVRAPGKGEFFSKGLDHKVRGTTGWASYETPFFFQKGERADLVKLNVAFEGAGGSLTIKDVELWKSPLP